MKTGIWKKRIYYHDTDCGGVVYYANYLKFLEEARTEFAREHGINTRELVGEGIYFVVAHVDISYKAPARYQDEIRVETAVEKVGRSSVVFDQRVFRDDTLLIAAKVTWVCVNPEFKPRQAPPAVLDWREG